MRSNNTPDNRAEAHLLLHITRRFEGVYTVMKPNFSTNPDSFNHEADVSDAHEVCHLVNGVECAHMAGDLQRK